MKERFPPRKPVVLSESTKRRLEMYALAASAAGVGVLGLAQPADAKIVYTPAHIIVNLLPVPLDLNHDGIVDFYLVLSAFSNSLSLSVCEYLGSNGRSLFCSNRFRGTNAIRSAVSGGEHWAAALRYGAGITGRGQFANSRAQMARVEGTTRWSGPWANRGKGVKSRYLGLKFNIKGEFHFGWARLNVLTETGGFIDATLTGYAYETIPNKGIIAGKTKGPDVVTLHNHSLGHLARGATAVKQ